MPKRKPSKKQESSDSDSGPEDRGPAKKEKTEENSWDLGNKRFVKLSEFKGKWYVSIREYYDSDGDLKPGKKGIMLSMDQWQKFKGAFDEIDEAVKKNV